MISENVRVRFAPSPTGYLHVGGLRTALYNFLFAKANNGKFILRIEDTDQNRYVEGAVENLINTLNWVGLIYDEGPEIEGNYGPYFQSKRLDIYKKYALELIEKKKAYFAFDTPERIQELREKQIAEKLQPKYDKAALDLSDEEVEEKLANGEPYVIRMNVSPGLRVMVEDKIRGLVEFNTDTVDDQILIKSDGFPTYHLANVVDDHLMKITHVIRGEEWLPSTPKHVLLYDFFGWEKPQFAHLPLLLNPDKSKLSKRQGDVAVEVYKAKGYLKEALVNFVALLGWNAGDEKEFYQLEELITNFSLERVHKAGAVFNLEKLDWLNFEHLRNKPVDEVLRMLKEEIDKSKFAQNSYNDEYLINIINAMRERVNFVKEYLTNSNYFFEEPAVYDEEVIKKRWKEDSANLLQKLNIEFSTLENPVKEDYEIALKKVAETESVGVGKLIHPLRLAVSGVGGGPGVYDILVIIGKEKTVSRINKAIAEIKP